MYFGFFLDLSDIDLWNTDLLDTHLGLFDTDIPCKHFFCLHNVFKTSSRHDFKHLQEMSSRRLQEDQEMFAGYFWELYIFFQVSN